MQYTKMRHQIAGEICLSVCPALAARQGTMQLKRTAYVWSLVSEGRYTCFCCLYTDGWPAQSTAHSYCKDRKNNDKKQI